MDKGASLAGGISLQSDKISVGGMKIFPFSENTRA